jgi:hypothetical protein
MLTVSTITCPLCGQTIYSRCRHDIRWCKCASICIDGGFDYVKIGWFPNLMPPETKNIEINTTKKELYNDWNKDINKFGVL